MSLSPPSLLVSFVLKYYRSSILRLMNSGSTRPVNERDERAVQNAQGAHCEGDRGAKIGSEGNALRVEKKLKRKYNTALEKGRRRGSKEKGKGRLKKHW